MNSVVLDACVLYSAQLRSFLLWLAHAELFHPIWTAEIQDEWFRTLLPKRPELAEKLERTHQIMVAEFPRSFVRGYESRVPALQLPDVKDRHVLAVAIHMKAKYIVTLNLNDFPQTSLQPCGIEAISPDDFVFRLTRESPMLVVLVAKRHRRGLIRPPLSVNEYLVMLEKQGLLQTVAFLRKYENSI